MDLDEPLLRGLVALLIAALLFLLAKVRFRQKGDASGATDNGLD